MKTKLIFIILIFSKSQIAFSNPPETHVPLLQRIKNFISNNKSNSQNQELISNTNNAYCIQQPGNTLINDYSTYINEQELILYKLGSHLPDFKIIKNLESSPLAISRKKLGEKIDQYDIIDHRMIVNLDHICLGHPILFPSAQKEVKLRAEHLMAHKSKILKSMKGKQGFLSAKDYANYTPSLQPIILYKYRDRYFANEGNGRISALKKVFGKNSKKIKIEVIVKEAKEPDSQEKLNQEFDQFYNLFRTSERDSLEEYAKSPESKDSIKEFTTCNPNE